jgi:cbb3-type cytochrome oxidase subunit 3
MEDFINHFRSNPAPWLIGLFFGVFYWAFRDRMRRRWDVDKDL